MTHAEQEKQRELRLLFDTCDIKGDGQVGLGELILQCRKHKIIGAIFKACSKDEGGRSIEQLFREMDRDGSGTIGWEEFYRFFVREIHEEHEKKEVQKALCSIVLRLLRNHDLERTATCLESEAGVRLEAPSSSEEGAEKSDVVKRFLHRTSETQARERERFASIQDEFLGQQRRLGDMTSQMAQIRTAALEQSKMSEQAAQKQAALQRLEQEHRRCLNMKRDIDAENDAVGAECDELLRLLAGAEQTEESLIAELALLTKEAAALRGAQHMTLEEKIRHLLLHWQEKGGAVDISNQAFSDMDRGGDNRITWHNHELRNFVTDFLERVEVPMPRWSDFVWFEIYRNVDCAGDDALDRVEGGNFCRHVLDAILHHVTDDPHSRAEHWARAYAGRKVLVSQTPVAYNRAVIIDIRAVAAAEFEQYHQENLEHRERMVQCIESGTHAPRTLQEYKKCDSDHNGYLSWNNGEVRNFVECAFVEHNLQPPPEQIVFFMYNAFLPKGKRALDAFECVCMADALFRCSFYRSQDSPASSSRPSARKPGTVGSARTSSTTATPVKRASTTRKLPETHAVGGRAVPKRSGTVPAQAAVVRRTSHTSVLDKDASSHSIGHVSNRSDHGPDGSPHGSPIQHRGETRTLTAPEQVGKPTLRNVVKVVQNVHQVTGVRRSGTMHTSPPPKQLTRPAAPARPVYGHG